MPRTFWIHEDDIAQVQFMPSACRDFCIQQLREIARHDIAHRDPDGIGWTAMYSIPPSPLPIAHLKIRPGDIAAAMPWRMRRVRRVMTGGWSGEGTPMERTAAYMSGRAAIVFSWNESKIVQSLWYHDAVLSSWHRRPMLEALFRLGILAPLLLVDWRGRILDLGDRKAIRRFLEGDETAAVEIPDGPPRPEKPEPPPRRSDSLYRFDLPVRPVLLTRKFSKGPVCAVVAADGGDAWSIEIGPAALEDGPVGMPSPIRPTGDRTISEWWDVANGRVLALCDYGGPEHADVWNARDGAGIFTARNPEAVVLCPDGVHLLNFDSDGIAVTDLRDPDAPARQSGLFPFDADEDQASRRQGDVTLDSPSSVMAVAHNPDGRDMTLAIGDYGFTVVVGIRIGGAGEPP